MTLLHIIWKNACQRRGSSILTGFSVAVGVALIIAILIIKLVSQERLRVGYSGFDLVVGAKGSPLQLTLNVVYNLDTSPGNIPFELYEKLEKDSRVKMVVPYSVGDNYKGFRIVGTTDEYLKKFEPRPNQPFELAGGRIFRFQETDLRVAMRDAVKRGKQNESGAETHQHHEGIYEAVLGSIAAETTGLKVGDSFVATHGVEENAEGVEHAESPWTVVGILKPTGTPSDRAIYINLDSFYHITGHVIAEKPSASGKKEKADQDPEIGQISALALKTRSPIALWSLRKELNEREDSQAAVPAEEIRKLLSIVGNVDRIILAQAILIVIVSAIGTGLAMFNSMNDRRRDIAVMRALGARRRSIVAIIVGEAVLIAGLGGVGGVLLGHGVILLAGHSIQMATGFMIPAWHFYWFEGVVLLGMIFVGIVAGIGPAISAYQTDVATGLTPGA